MSKSSREKNLPYITKLLEQRGQPASTVKPFLLVYLDKLRSPVPKEIETVITVAKCYNRIYKQLRILLGLSVAAPVGNFYWLWCNGIPLDVLKTFTRQQAAEWKAKLYKPKAPTEKPPVEATK